MQIFSIITKKFWNLLGIEILNKSDKFYTYFKKNQGRNFINFLIKERDEQIKSCVSSVFADLFQDFMPSIENIPFSVIATNKYAQSLISVNSQLNILIVYKDIKGFDTKNILKALTTQLNKLDLKIKAKFLPLELINETFKDDFKAKSSVSFIRYICGSKAMYKLARDEINTLKTHNQADFIAKHTKSLLPFNQIPLLEQTPNLKSSYGGVDEIYALNCILSTLSCENQIRLSTLNLLDEKQISQFNLSLDFLLSLKSLLNLVNDDEIFSEKNIETITKLLQTKSTKSQDTNIRISQKILNSMRNLGLYARFVIAYLNRKNKAIYTFTQKRLSRTKCGLYAINDTLYAPLHKKPTTITTLLKQLNTLADINYKLDISAIFYIKNTKADENEQESKKEQIKRLFSKNNAFCLLEALCDASIMGSVIKPMENIAHLPKYDGYHTLSVDDHSIISVKFLENIKDKFIKNLYDELCLEGKIMLKLVTLMHDVGKGVSDSDHAVVGANIFRAYANRLELSQNAVNTGVTLIKYHTLMQDVANREDIYLERTIFGFISKLGDKKTLDLAYILSYCILNATDEALYTPYTAKLLRKLYDISRESFDDETLLDEATRRVKKETSIKRHDEFDKLEQNIKDKIFKISSNLLFVKHNPADIIAIAKKANEVTDTSVNISNTQNLSVKIISAKQINLASLLTVLADFDLAYMEIFKLFDEKFFIRLEFNKNVKNAEILNLKAKAIQSLKSDEILKISRPNITKDEITFELNHSNEYARLNINTRDQRGLMAYVMSVFSKADVKITSAKVQTIKNRTRNLFLIEKSDMLCYNSDKILNLLTSE